jgi:hypothetical protein
MSGGHFDHQQYKILRIAHEIEDIIRYNGTDATDSHGFPLGYNFNDDTIIEFEKAVILLRRAHIYAQRIDWLVSGDDGENTFHERLEEEHQRETEYLVRRGRTGV